MAEVYDQDADVFFGEIENEEEVDWREEPEETDPDDELPENTEDVEAILGFDPKGI